MFSGHIFMLDFLKMKPITWQDKEDSGDKGQDGAMRPDVADIAEHKADEHEEKADQRERSGRADHLCKQAYKKSTSVLLCFFTLKLRVKLLGFFSLFTEGCFPQQVRSRSFQYMVSKMEMEVPTVQMGLCPQGMCVPWCMKCYHVSECEAYIIGGSRDSVINRPSHIICCSI